MLNRLVGFYTSELQAPDIIFPERKIVSAGHNNWIQAQIQLPVATLPANMRWSVSFLWRIRLSKTPSIHYSVILRDDSDLK